MSQGSRDEYAGTKSRPGDLRFASIRETAEQQSALLRKAGADIIVLVSHSNRATDTELMNAGVADVILSGDDHDIFLNYNGKSAVVEAGQDGLIIAAVDLTVDVTEKDRQTPRRVVAAVPLHRHRRRRTRQGRRRPRRGL